MNEKYLNTIVNVKIDRPLGSKHPEYDFIYPLNYGFVPNTISGDDEELDVYVLGENRPLKTYRGKVIAIIHRLDDNDDKLVVTAENKTFTDNEIKNLTNFQEKWFKSIIIR